jgi:hypothetical protein
MQLRETGSPLQRQQLYGGPHPSDALHSDFEPRTTK